MRYYFLWEGWTKEVKIPWLWLPVAGGCPLRNRQMVEGFEFCQVSGDLLCKK